MARQSQKWSNVDLPEKPVADNEWLKKVLEAKDKLVVCKICRKSQGGHTAVVGSIPPMVEGWHAWEPEPMTMQEIADLYRSLEAQDQKAKEQQSIRNIWYAAIERRVMELLEGVKTTSGQDMWRGAGTTFSPKFTPDPVIEDPKALRQWIADNDMEDMLTLPTGRLQEIVKSALDPEIAAILTPAAREQLAKSPGAAGSGAPPPGVKVFMRKGVNVGAGRGSKKLADQEE